MIRGVHTMFYTSEPEALRAFFRDKLDLPCTDAGDGWLIFDIPNAEMGCHPTGNSATTPSGMPSISFYCDDIDKTVQELKSRGVEFTGEIIEAGYGRATHFKVPGGFEVEVYEPNYDK